MPEFLRHHGERETVLRVVHEFPRPRFGKAVARTVCAAALPERLHAGARERRAERVSAADVVALDVADAAVDDGRRAPMLCDVGPRLSVTRGLKGSIDAAVVDLNLGRDTRDGGEVINELKAHFRVLVAVPTGTPGAADDEAPVVRVFTKGEHGFEEVLDRLWAIHEVGLSRVMGGRGLLEERLNRVFLNNLVPMIDVWIGYGTGDTNRTGKALLRNALGHLVADLEGDETPCYPEEFYLDPRLEPSLTTGSRAPA